MKDRYREFCQTQTDLPLFHQPWYLDATAGKEDWDVALVERQEQVIAALPYVYIQRDLLPGLGLPPLIPRLGPFLSPAFRNYERQHKYLFHLIEQLPPFDFFQQDFHPGITNWLPFHWNSFHQTTHYTYQVDLTHSMETLYNAMNPDYRLNKISNARRFVRTVLDRPLADFYPLYVQEQEERGETPVTHARLSSLFEELERRKAGKLFCTIDGLHQLQSACLLVWDKHTAYVLLHALQPALTYPDAIIIVLWEALHYTRNILQLPTFDLLSGMDKTKEQLYRGFGAAQIPYFSIHKGIPVKNN